MTDVLGEALNNICDGEMDWSLQSSAVKLPDFLRQPTGTDVEFKPTVIDWQCGSRVRKINGSLPTGIIIAAFTTTAGKSYVVVEIDAPLAGLLHICRPDELDVI